MAEVLAVNGARVVMADIDGPRLQASAKRLLEHGLDVEIEVLDVTDPEAMKSVVSAICSRKGKLDIAIVNAGISVGPGFVAPEGRIENVPSSSWQKVVDVNLGGAFYTLQAVSAAMKRQASGRIVVIGSMAGIRSQPNIGYAYIASKAAVTALTRQLSLELASHGVAVNGIAPGPFATQIAEGRINRPEVAPCFAAMSPMNRVALAEEIKGAAMLLASNAGSFMTGAIIAVDGGMSAQ